MLVKALKSFPYSDDGIRIRTIAEGAVENLRDELVPGLAAEGYVAHADAPPPDDFTPRADEMAAATADLVEGINAKTEAAEAYPHLSPAQIEALDHIDDGILKPGGSPKGGNRRKRK